MQTTQGLWKENSVFESPWRHAVINEVFTPHTLQLILENLPGDDIEPVDDYSPYGRAYAVGKDDCVSSKFWSNLHRFFNSTDVLEYVENILCVPIKLTKAYISVHKDYAGHQLGPHIDGSYTFHIYLTPTVQPFASGTEYYKKGNNLDRHNSELADWSEWMVYKTIPALQNTGHMWVPTDKSYHGYYELKENRTTFSIRFT